MEFDGIELEALTNVSVRPYRFNPEVEMELRSNKKHKKLIDAQFDRAMGSILQLFDERSMIKFLTGSEKFLPAAVARR